MRWRRLLAFVIDWCCMLGWVAVVAAVGVPLYLGGIIRLNGFAAQNLVGLIVVVPIVVAAAWCESRWQGATPGKHVLGLAVEVVEVDAAGHADEPVSRASFPRALLRNALKIGVPWAIGHAAVFALVDTPASTAPPAWSWWLLVAAYVLPLAWLISLLTPGARTIYDRVSGTHVGSATVRHFAHS